MHFLHFGCISNRLPFEFMTLVLWHISFVWDSRKCTVLHFISTNQPATKVQTEANRDLQTQCPHVNKKCSQKRNVKTRLDEHDTILMLIVPAQVTREYAASDDA